MLVFSVKEADGLLYDTVSSAYTSCVVVNQLGATLPVHVPKYGLESDGLLHESDGGDDGAADGPGQTSWALTVAVFTLV